MIAIGLRNPYAKSETGAGLVPVWCLLTVRCLMFYGYICCLTGSKYLEYNSSIRTETILNKSNNRTLNKHLTEYWIIEQSKPNKNRTDRIIGWTAERNNREQNRTNRKLKWIQDNEYETFCFRPRGIILIESTQIRWFSRWSGGGGWSGRAEAQRRPRVSKLRAKGLSGCHSSEITAEAARREARGPS